MSEVMLIIPAFNEAENISEVLENVLEKKYDLDVLVINDGSKDSTLSQAMNFNVKVISHPFNMGYGSALQTGFKYAFENGYKYIVQFDADGQHRIENVQAIIDELKKGEVDLVIGSRFLKNGTLKCEFPKRVMISFFRHIIRRCSGVSLTDPTSGLKGMSRRLFSYYSKMGKFPPDYPDADVLIRTARCGFIIKEVPADMKERLKGESMHNGLKPIYYVFKVLLSIFTVMLIDLKEREGMDFHGVKH